MPKSNESDKNMGVCTFIAVNPNSKNRDEALNYIKDWIRYRMNQVNSPLYFQSPIIEEDSLRGSLYELYKNGEITFYIDRDIYSDGFFDVVENNGDIDSYIEDTKRKLYTYFNE